MITRLDLPIHERLDLLRVDSGLRLNQVAKTLNVEPKTVSQWGYGQTSPSVWHAIAYAALVGHRLVLVRRGIVVCDLQDVLRDPAGFRKRHRLSQQQVADRMRVGQHSVSALELRVSRGADVSLATLSPYLAAHGYQVVLAPAQPLERAA